MELLLEWKHFGVLCYPLLGPQQNDQNGTALTVCIKVTIAIVLTPREPEMILVTG